MHRQRVVSLWEMLSINALNFVTAFAQVERIAVLMLEWEEPTKPDLNAPLAASLRKLFAKHYQEIAQAAEAMGLPVTKIAAVRSVSALKSMSKQISFADVKSMNAELGNRLEDEILSIKLYCLPAGADIYYNPLEPLFGRVVAARIEGANDDIAEAGNCFAVGRYTASAFHLMRAMEVAVQQLSRELDIVNVEKEWGKLLSEINSKIVSMPKGQGKDAWSGVHANLYHVKQAWRNSTMHPKRTYTEEEAKEVFGAVKVFMRELADLLPVSIEEIVG